MDAKTLRCPHCGANTAAEAPRCQYCRAKLATVSCPGCFSLMFSDAVYCPNCGVRRQRREEPADASCPGCRGGLHTVSIGTTPLLECERCSGLWVAADVFEHLCADRESQAAVLHQRAERSPVTRHRVSYRPCVRCGAMMNRVNFGRLSGVVVDVCRAHGTFLDSGELQAIVAFIQAGGLDRARQRQIEDLKAETQRLRDQERRLRDARYGNGGTGISGSFDLFVASGDD